MVAAIRAQGVAERDVQTSSLNLNPRVDYAGGRGPPRVAGYQASNQVTVVVRDLARVGPVVDAVVGAGANQVHSIGFGLEDPDAALEQARRTAVRDLRRKAEAYAAAADLRVARLVTLTETLGYAPGRPYVAMESSADSMAPRAVAPPPPIAPGQVQVQVHVTGVYELRR